MGATAFVKHGRAIEVYKKLTHWGRVTHICASKLTSIGTGNGLSPGRRQPIIWTNAGILLTGPLGTNFSDILIKIHTFSIKKVHLNRYSAEWRPFCLGLNLISKCWEGDLSIFCALVRLHAQWTERISAVKLSYSRRICYYTDDDYIDFIFLYIYINTHWLLLMYCSSVSCVTRAVMGGMHTPHAWALLLIHLDGSMLVYPTLCIFAQEQWLLPKDHRGPSQ